jgi:hypothetical protein
LFMPFGPHSPRESQGIAGFLIVICHTSWLLARALRVFLTAPASGSAEFGTGV